jgi:hypothetical protein
MKRLLSTFVVLSLLSFTTTDPSTISEKERKAAIAYYNEGTQNLLTQVKDLSEAQLNWKPNDSTWSIADCIEHIAISEKNIFDWAMSTLKEPADPAKKSEVKLSDEQVKAFIESREKKVKTREAFKPTGQFGNTQQTLAVFEQRRADNVKYIQSTQDDLHNHFAQTPLGTLNTYQVLLFLNAHTKRHTAQIAELKSMPGFPK